MHILLKAVAVRDLTLKGHGLLPQEMDTALGVKNTTINFLIQTQLYYKDLDTYRPTNAFLQLVQQ
jgi:hypothetical protein